MCNQIRNRLRTTNKNTEIYQWSLKSGVCIRSAQVDSILTEPDELAPIVYFFEFQNLIPDADNLEPDLPECSPVRNRLSEESVIFFVYDDLRS